MALRRRYVLRQQVTCRPALPSRWIIAVRPERTLQCRPRLRQLEIERTAERAHRCEQRWVRERADDGSVPTRRDPRDAAPPIGRQPERRVGQDLVEQVRGIAVLRQPRPIDPPTIGSTLGQDDDQVMCCRQLRELGMRMITKVRIRPIGPVQQKQHRHPRTGHPPRNISPIPHPAAQSGGAQLSSQQLRFRLVAHLLQRSGDPERVASSRNGPRS